MNIERYTTKHQLLYHMNDIIEERKVLFIDNTSDILVNQEEYISPHAVILLCHSGNSWNEYNMKSAVVQTHDISVMPPGHIVKHLSTSPDYSTQMVIICKSFSDLIKQKYLTHYLATHKSFLEYPNMHLSDEQYRQVCYIFNHINTACNVKGHYKEDLISSAIHSLMLLLSTFRNEQSEYLQSTPQLSQQFNNALYKHFNESHKVSFYADMFNLSPKYFSTLIKQETGITASEWINRYIVMQAKLLLNQRCNLSIQQVAYQLGFSEQASFSRFFKRETSLSPTEFQMR